jgi:hypothetical protein
MVNPIGVPQPPAPPLPPQPPAEEQPPPPDEPEPKRLRTDDASLIPAEQFLAQYPVMALALHFSFLVSMLVLVILLLPQSQITIHFGFSRCIPLLCIT